MFVTKKKYKQLEEKYNELLELETLPTVEKIEMMKNNIQVEFGSNQEALVAWSQIFTNVFVECGAGNYLEMILGKGTDRYIFTIRKFFGKTPDQLKREAEEKVKTLEEEIKRLKGIGE